MIQINNNKMAYKTKQFFNYLNTLDDKLHLENLIKYNTALIKAGLKPSVTLTMLKGQRDLYSLWLKFGESLLHKLSLNHVILRDNKNSLILFIYDTNILENYLQKKHNNEFLKSLGYDTSASTKNIVNYLKIRYNIFHCPHELGVFLGYPLDDVKEFMSCTPKKCLLCGYWKVYNNCQSAINTFTLYDKARENLIDDILIARKKLTS